MPGFFIAVEGIDGAGKTTLCNSLKRELQRRGYDVVLTREPTSGRYGLKLREKIKTGNLTPQEERDLFLKDRKEHVKKVIKPSLDSGRIVISDRYYYSTCAYQGARGFDPWKICKENSIFPKPDLVILLDIKPENALKRKDIKEEHFERVDFLKRVREIYLQVVRKTNYVIIDANLSQDCILKEAMKCIEEHLKR